MADEPASSSPDRQASLAHPPAPQTSEQLAAAVEEIKRQWPLHYYVWGKDLAGLEAIIKELKAKGQLAIDQLDPRRRTPLMLAIGMFYKQMALHLLNYFPDVNIRDEHGFAAWHEAQSTKDFELCKEVFRHKELSRLKSLLAAFYSKYDYFTSGNKAAQVYAFKLHYKLHFIVPLPFGGLNAEDTMYVKRINDQIIIGYTLQGIDNSGRVPKVKRAKTALCINFAPTQVTMWTISEDFRLSKKMVYPVGDDQALLDNIIIHDEKIIRKISEKVVKVRNYRKTTLEEMRRLWKSEARQITIEGIRCAGYSLKVDEDRATRIEDIEVTKAMEFRNDLRNPHNLTFTQYFCGSPELDICLPGTVKMVKDTLKGKLWVPVPEDVGKTFTKDELYPVLQLMAIHNKFFEKAYQFMALQPTDFCPVRLEYPVNSVFNATITIQRPEFPRDHPRQLFDPLEKDAATGHKGPPHPPPPSPSSPASTSSAASPSPV